MQRFLTIPALVISGLLFAFPPSSARGEHATITLTVEMKGKTVEAHDDDEPPLGGRDKRIVQEVKAGSPLVMQFLLTNIYPHEIRKKVVVLYYVIRINAVRQKPTPSPKDTKPEDVIAQGRVQMNFKPKCRVGARLKFRLPKTGVYRVRVETQNTKSDHEHFSAIDLIAK